ncbi:MAG: FtsQ-type POTRA domain-containing protein [Nitrospinota bacterium]|nr:FtsQ-type POTRA domain-containing protein [Nitrospinota bacterium]
MMRTLVKNKIRTDRISELPKYKSALGSQRVHLAAAKQEGPGIFGKFLMQLVLFTVTALILTACYHVAVTHPVFIIKKVKVIGNEMIAVSDILGKAAGSLRGNIFMTDLDAVSEIILQNPWLESVSFEKELPSTLAVTVAVRKAEAVIVAGEEKYLVSRDGIILGKASDSDGFLMVTGFSGGFRPGDVIDRAEFDDAFAIKNLFNRENVFHDQIVEVDIGNPDRLKAVTGKDRIFISFPSKREEWKEKFLEYLAVRKILASRGETAKAIDLSFKNQVVVVRGGQENEPLRKEKNNFTL